MHLRKRCKKVLTLEPIPQHMTDHRHYSQYYEAAKHHSDEITPIAYKAQTLKKKQAKLQQFGDETFQGLTKGVSDDY